MRFTVVWEPEAYNDLADLWLNAVDRDRIVFLAESIDLELTVDPFWKSAELSEGLRALNLPPLRILFTVNVEDRVVDVERIIRLPE